MEKKLEIIGPYTPEHPGPFCTRDGRPARIICTDRKSSNGHSIVALVDDGDQEMNRAFNTQGEYCLSDRDFDLMNAREVPVAREFWVNEYRNGGWGGVFETEEKAAEWKGSFNFIRTIHVREVLSDAETVTAPAGVVKADRPIPLPTVAWCAISQESNTPRSVWLRDAPRPAPSTEFEDDEACALVFRADAMHEIRRLQHALNDARSRILSLVHAKPVGPCVKASGGEGHVQ